MLHTYMLMCLFIHLDVFMFIRLYFCYYEHDYVFRLSLPYPLNICKGPNIDSSTNADIYHNCNAANPDNYKAFR